MVCFIAAQVAVAIQQLHTIDIVHLDIKLENVMLDRHGKIKLIDFGFSRQIGCTRKRKLRSLVGTVAYNAPEIGQTHYDHRVDWYSFGVLLYFLNGGGIDDDQNFSDLRTTLPKESDEECLAVVLRCTEPSASKRVSSLNDLLNMPYFSSIQWSDLQNCAGSPPAELKQMLKMSFPQQGNQNICKTK